MRRGHPGGKWRRAADPRPPAVPFQSTTRRQSRAAGPRPSVSVPHAGDLSPQPQAPSPHAPHRSRPRPGGNHHPFRQRGDRRMSALSATVFPRQLTPAQWTRPYFAVDDLTAGLEAVKSLRRTLIREFGRQCRLCLSRIAPAGPSKSKCSLILRLLRWNMASRCLFSASNCSTCLSLTVISACPKNRGVAADNLLELGVWPFLPKTSAWIDTKCPIAGIIPRALLRAGDPGEPVTTIFSGHDHGGRTVGIWLEVASWSTVLGVDGAPHLWNAPSKTCWSHYPAKRSAEYLLVTGIARMPWRFVKFERHR